MSSSRMKSKVVVADDDPIIRQLMQSKLTQLGCEPLLAEDGMEAWQLLRGKNINLAIVDLEMPNIAGIPLIQAVRGHPRTKHLPIIVVTSRRDATAIQEAFEAGATSFLTKPVNWSTFGSHIEYLMRLSQSANQARNRAQCAEAAARVRDAIMRGACVNGAKNAAKIKRTARLILDGIIDPEQARMVERRVQTILEDAASVENALLQAQRLTKSLSGTLKNADTLVPLINILAQAQTRIGELSTQKNAPVCFSRVPEDAFVACDPDSMATAVTHLLDNAVRYSPAGQTVILEADVHEDGMLTVAITDSGPGMQPEFYANRLGYQPDEECRELEQDAGLGLPLVKAIVEAHGGALEIRSMPGEGTTAMIVIPADRVSLETAPVEDWNAA